MSKFKPKLCPKKACPKGKSAGTAKNSSVNEKRDAVDARGPLRSHDRDLETVRKTPSLVVVEIRAGPGLDDVPVSRVSARKIKTEA